MQGECALTSQGAVLSACPSSTSQKEPFNKLKYQYNYVIFLVFWFSQLWVAEFPNGFRDSLISGIGHWYVFLQ